MSYDLSVIYTNHSTCQICNFYLLHNESCVVSHFLVEDAVEKDSNENRIET